MCNYFWWRVQIISVLFFRAGYFVQYVPCKACLAKHWPDCPNPTKSYRMCFSAETVLKTWREVNFSDLCWIIGRVLNTLQSHRHEAYLHDISPFKRGLIKRTRKYVMSGDQNKQLKTAEEKKMDSCSLIWLSNSSLTWKLQHWYQSKLAWKPHILWLDQFCLLQSWQPSLQPHKPVPVLKIKEH